MNTSLITIFSIVFFALAGAIYLFIKTPTSQRWSSPIERKEGVEYAPLYTASERIRLFAIHACWLIPALALWHYYFLPRFKEFAANAECYEIASVNGVKLIFFGLYVGLPLIIAISIFCIEGVGSIRAFKTAQYPPPGEKVFKLTPYKYGRVAKCFAIFPFLLILFVLCFGVWGGYQATNMTKEVKPCKLTSR